MPYSVKRIPTLLMNTMNYEYSQNRYEHKFEDRQIDDALNRNKAHSMFAYWHKFNITNPKCIYYSTTAFVKAKC